MRAEDVRLIVIEPFRERRNPDFVAENTGARVLSLPTMPDGENTPDYLSLIDYDVRQLVEALAAPATP
jgi:ABC-type Zn uptake system ZnuABC Zn-binding protein ZnuA